MRVIVKRHLIVQSFIHEFLPLIKVTKIIQCVPFLQLPPQMPRCCGKQSEFLTRISLG